MAEEYIFRGPPELNIPNISLGQLVLNKLREHGHRVGLVDASNGESATYYELYQKSVLLAQNLQLLGIRKGDSIGICSENVVNFALPVLASTYLGATCAPYNSLYSQGELLHQMSISRPRIVFVSASTLVKVQEVIQQLDCVRDIVLMYGAPPPDTTGFSLLSDLLNPVGQPVNLFQAVRVDPKVDTAVVLASSGTTGLPKSVELTHANHIYFINVITACNPIYPDDVFPGFIPFFHGYGFGLLMMSLCMGVKLISLPRFEDKLFLKAIEDYKITRLFAVPPVMVFLGKHPMVDNYDLSHLRSITCGAAPLSKEAQDAVEKRIGVKDIRQGYGMTETSIVVSVAEGGIKNKSGSSGRLVPGLLAKVVDMETGKTLPPNKPGLLLVKGPMIMKGYRNNPTATAEMFDKDGWLITGDVVYIDEDNFLFVVDRVKELIKYKAFQVPPAELEAILYTNPEIRDAAVVGKPDADAGELPLAFVVRQPNSKITEKDILEYVAARVSPHKKLRGGVQFVDEIPRNPSGKILRRVLRSKL